MTRVSIIGATGLAGECLIRALLGHPKCELSLLVSAHAAGKKIGDLLPPLRNELDMVTVDASPEEIAKASDVVYLAKAGTESFKLVPALLKNGAKVIDIGAEYRFKDAAIYEQWYKEKHECKELLEQTVYGLPELFKETDSARRRQTRRKSGLLCYHVDLRAGTPLLSADKRSRRTALSSTRIPG